MTAEPITTLSSLVSKWPSGEEIEVIAGLLADISDKLRQHSNQFILLVLEAQEIEFRSSLDPIERYPHKHLYLGITGKRGFEGNPEGNCQLSFGNYAHCAIELSDDNIAELHEGGIILHSLLPQRNFHSNNPVSNLEFIIGDEKVREWFLTWMDYDHTILWKMAKLISRPIAEYPELTEELTKKRQEITVKLINLVNEMNRLTSEDSTSERVREQLTTQVKKQLKLAIKFDMAGYTLISIPGLCQEFGIDMRS